MQAAHQRAEGSARLHQAAREELLLDTMAGVSRPWLTAT